MSTYKQIHGENIEIRSSDPGNPVEGQIWYNTTGQALKGTIVDPGTWVTGGFLNSLKFYLTGMGENNSSALVAGSNVGTTNAFTESYNGTSWTEVGDLNTGRSRMAGCGTQTAGLVSGGDDPGSVPEVFAGAESWNGTSWTSVASMNTARFFATGFGTNTAAITAGGEPPGPVVGKYTESWNGTSWTEVSDLNQARISGGSNGTQTSGLIYGAGTVDVESWNGSAWTEVANINTLRTFAGGAGADNTSALAFGGIQYPTSSAKTNTESWNGSSWTEVNDMITARYSFGAPQGGTVGSAFAAGGDLDPGESNLTEEWNQGPFNVTF